MSITKWKWSYARRCTNEQVAEREFNANRLRMWRGRKQKTITLKQGIIVHVGVGGGYFCLLQKVRLRLNEEFTSGCARILDDNGRHLFWVRIYFPGLRTQLNRCWRRK